MILHQRTCPKCGSALSMPMPSRRTGLVLQTCREMACQHTVWSATPLTSPPAAPSDHSQMFVPDTSRPEPPRPRSGAMDQFNRAAVAGTLREAIQKSRRHAAEAAAIDPKLRQIGGDR